MGTRRKAREYVMRALFAQELSGSDPEHTVRTVIHPLKEEVGPDARSFAEDLFQKALEHRTELDRLISRHSTNWDLDRIALIDKILLRIALAEFLYTEDIPPKVSIDEAIEIAKSYSTPDSSRFINGVLDAALETLYEEGRIEKKGRGLIGTDSLPS